MEDLSDAASSVPASQQTGRAGIHPHSQHSEQSPTKEPLCTPVVHSGWRVMAKRVDWESPIQIAIVNYLRLVMPDAIVHHCKNEINKRGKAIANELYKAKIKGAVPGFPDLLVLPYSTIGPMFFEVKAEGNYATSNQKEVHEHLRRLGYRVAVVRSIDDVRECLSEWSIPTNHIEHRGQIS